MKAKSQKLKSQNTEAVSFQLSAFSREAMRPRVSSISAFGFWRFGFSMIELMIAIMILGIGLVMLATVFPVGLDMTRQTVEKSVSLAAAEAAIQILQLKVPTAHDELTNVVRLPYPPIPTPWPGPTNTELVFFPRSTILANDPVLLLLKTGASPLDPNLYSIETDANIQANDLDASTSFTVPSVYPATDIFVAADKVTTLPNLKGAFTNGSARDGFLQRSEAFTEVSAWDSDPPSPDPTRPSGTIDVSSFVTDVSYILRGENIVANVLHGSQSEWDVRTADKNPARPFLQTEFPPFIERFRRQRFDSAGASLGSIPDGNPGGRAGGRIHLLEQLYPPINLDLNQTQNIDRWGISATDLARAQTLSSNYALAARWTLERGLAMEVSQRRISWTAIHYRKSQPRHYGVTIVVTSRGDLTSNYAYQRDQRGKVDYRPYDLQAAAFLVTDDDPTKSLYTPLAAPDADRTSTTLPDLQDGLFPRPWLVAFGLPPGKPLPTSWKMLTDGTNFFESRGNHLLCTTDVARLIPAGSAFVIARGPLVGRVISVVASSFDQNQLGVAPESQTPADIQVDNLPEQIMNDPIADGQQIYAWVFPPAVLRTGASTFDLAARSPVISAFEREVTLP